MKKSLLKQFSMLYHNVAVVVSVYWEMFIDWDFGSILNERFKGYKSLVDVNFLK